MDPNDLAEMERLLGRQLTAEERRLLSLSSRVRPINFRRREEIDGESQPADKRRAKAAGE